MTAQQTVQDGSPNWIDLGTNDVDAAVAFYTGLFGWEHMSFGEEFGNYGQFLHAGEPVAGIGPNVGTDQPGEWCVYLATSDADATAAAVTAHGGTVVVPPEDIAGQGRFVVSTDPTGATVSFWQPGTHRGFARVAEPGAPCWFEVWTDDYDAALAFYRDALGWEPHQMPGGEEFRYATNAPEATATAGIYDAATDLSGTGSRWLTYLGAADVDAAAARVTELGGTVESDPVDTPFGRMADVRDPDGALFRLVAA